MTTWTINLTDAEMSTFRRTHSQMLVHPQFDAQVGDRVSIYRKGSSYSYHSAEIIHVMQNVAGIERGWLVLTLRNNDVDDFRFSRNRAEERADHAERSRNSLRGQITKLKKQIAEMKEAAK